MRWRQLFVVMIGLALGAGAIPARAAGRTHGRGCIGGTTDECVSWLRATMAIDEQFLVGAMAHRHDTDVNGRPISGGLVTVYAKLPGEYDPFVILLHLQP